MFGKPKTIPSKADALPGRAERMPVPDAHFVNGHRLTPPFPDGLARALFGMGCFWGAEKKFWQLDGVYTTAVGYAAGHTPNPTYREVCTGMTGHNEVVLVVFDPKKISYEDLLKVFWENHDPTQGMRQGNDVGTQYRSGIYYFDDEQRRAAERSREAFQKRPDGRRLRSDHHRDPAGAGVLLRRGLSPAVPRQESRRLLRHRRHRRELPDRSWSERVTAMPAEPRATSWSSGARSICYVFRSTPSSKRSSSGAPLARGRRHRRAGRGQDHACASCARRRRPRHPASAETRRGAGDRLAHRRRARMDARARSRLADPLRAPLHRRHAPARRHRRHPDRAAAEPIRSCRISARSSSTSSTSGASTPTSRLRWRGRRGARATTCASS